MCYPFYVPVYHIYYIPKRQKIKYDFENFSVNFNLLVMLYKKTVK